MSAISFNHEQFQKALQENEYLLVDYWAPWCGYCRRIDPAYQKIAQQYSDKVLVAKVNIDEEPMLAHQQQIEVIPTLILYHKGEAAAFVVAPESKAAIEEFLNQSMLQQG